MIAQSALLLFVVAAQPDADVPCPAADIAVVSSLIAVDELCAGTSSVPAPPGAFVSRNLADGELEVCVVSRAARAELDDASRIKIVALDTSAPVPLTLGVQEDSPAGRAADASGRTLSPPGDASGKTPQTPPLIACSVIAPPAVTSPPAEQDSDHRETVFVLPVEREGVESAEANVAEGLFVAALSRDGRFAVTSGNDLRDMLSIEATKASLNCDEESSCLTELSGALGATYVVTPALSAVGRARQFSVRVIDAETLDVAGGASGRAATTFGLKPLFADIVHNAFAKRFGEPHRPIPEPTLARELGDSDSYLGGGGAALGAGVGAGACASCATGTVGATLPLILGTPLSILVYVAWTTLLAPIGCCGGVGGALGSAIVDDLLGFEWSGWRAVLVGVAAVVGALLVALAVGTIGLTVGAVVGSLVAPQLQLIAAVVGVPVAGGCGAAGGAAAAFATYVGSVAFVEDVPVIEDEPPTNPQRAASVAMDY